MTKEELIDMLLRVAAEYKHEGVIESVKRNKHMNNYNNERVSEETVDAILCDFINRVGTYQGIDLGLYTHYLDEEVEKIRKKACQN